MLVIHNGRALFVELKADGGKVSAVQHAAHAAIRDAGGLVATCDTLPDVLATLADWGVPLRGQIGRATETEGPRNCCAS